MYLYLQCIIIKVSLEVIKFYFGLWCCLVDSYYIILIFIIPGNMWYCNNYSPSFLLAVLMSLLKKLVFIKKGVESWILEQLYFLRIAVLFRRPRCSFCNIQKSLNIWLCAIEFRDIHFYSQFFLFNFSKIWCQIE